MQYSPALIKDLQNKAKALRKNVVISIGEGNFGHLGGSFSAADIVAALYFYKGTVVYHDKEETINLHKGETQQVELGGFT